MDILSFILGLQKGKSMGGGSASGELKIADGYFDTTETVKTVNHNLGYVPDILIVSTGAAPGAGIMFFAVGFSQAMLDALGGGYLCFAESVSGTGSSRVGSNVGMESANPSNNGSTYGLIRSVTNKSFTVGGSIFKLDTTSLHDSYENPYGVYKWLAISGITG